MSFITTSTELQPNQRVRAEKAKANESNLALLKRLGAKEGVVLLGGSSVADFRIRVAQSHLRHDLMPSYWSLAGVLRASTLWSVPFGSWTDIGAVPPTNAITAIEFRAFDDPIRFPNLAVISFSENIEPIVAAIEQLRLKRSVVDLPDMLLPWLGFIWSAGDRGNPVLRGLGLPSAALVETAYAMAGIELTPGLSSNASCPEAIWQAAKWWHGFYDKATQSHVSAREESGIARPVVPEGFAVVRQAAAAVVEARNSVVD